MPQYDLVIADASIVRPNRSDVPIMDVAIRGEKVVAVGPGLQSSGREIIDGSGLLCFPGAIDAHCHWGIYNPLEEDAISESRAAAQGGVTAALTYFRSGAYYLNRSGPYSELFPEVLRRCDGNSYIDYGFHLAPITRQHISEIPTLIKRFGVTSFKIFMFYGVHGLHGRSDKQDSFLMTEPHERYDLGHFEFIMRAVKKAESLFPSLANELSLSVHCENGEILRAYSEIVEGRRDLFGLEAYSESRPPHAEGLAILEASYLAHTTGITTLNLLHLSSAAAIEAALLARQAFPAVRIGSEVTVGHLLNDTESDSGALAKVNPPIRPRSDVNALWQAVSEGVIDWIVSDHACCKQAAKLGPDPEDIWSAKSGFGGTEYLFSAILSEGTKRGLSLNRVAELISWNPARRFGLLAKGDIAEGFDADLVLVDPSEEWTIRAASSESAQEYSPFEGLTMRGRVRDVILRGRAILRGGAVVGEPSGHYLHRPVL
jgi:allantoinase